MRTILKLLYEHDLKSKDGKPYTLRCYLLDDGQEVETIEKFKVGEEVTVWYDPDYDKAKLRKKRYDEHKELV